MAVDTAYPTLAALRGSARVVDGHGRGNRTRVLLDIGDALEPCVEGMALAEPPAGVRLPTLADNAGAFE